MNPETPQTETTEAAVPPPAPEPEATEPEAQAAPQPEAEAEEAVEEAEGEEEEEEEEYEEEEPPGTEYQNLIQELQMSKEMLARLPGGNPARLRDFLVNDLYGFLERMLSISDWYTGDLHQRVTVIEDEVGGGPGGGLDPEFATELIEFIGGSVKIFGAVISIPPVQGNKALMHAIQILIAQAPGLMSRIQDMTITDEDEEDEDEEFPNVMPPRDGGKTFEAQDEESSDEEAPKEEESSDGKPVEAEESSDENSTADGVTDKEATDGGSTES